MHNFRNLEIWQLSKSLVRKVYLLCEAFPPDVVYGLTSQIKRAVISIPSNIAEGAGRNSNKDFTRFLSLSQGSTFELETQLDLAQELKFVSEEELVDIKELISSIQKMNRAFQQTLLSRTK